MADTRLVQRSASSPVRTDTGIMATSGWSGRASWASSHVRSPPAQTAITTSLTVAPRAFLIALMSDSDAERKAKRRCAVMRGVERRAGAPTLGSGPTASALGLALRGRC